MSRTASPRTSSEESSEVKPDPIVAMTSAGKRSSPAKVMSTPEGGGVCSPSTALGSDPATRRAPLPASPPPSIRLPPSRSGRSRTSGGSQTRKLNVARIVWSVPTSGSSSRKRRAWGVWRHMNASMSTRPAAAAASKASATWAGCREYGFSQSTCLPAASARKVQGWWSEFGRQMYTASTPGSSRSASYDAWAPEMPKEAANAAAGSRVRLPTATTSALAAPRAWRMNRVAMEPGPWIPQRTTPDDGMGPSLLWQASANPLVAGTPDDDPLTGDVQDRGRVVAAGLREEGARLIRRQGGQLDRKR